MNVVLGIKNKSNKYTSKVLINPSQSYVDNYINKVVSNGGKIVSILEE